MAKAVQKESKIVYLQIGQNYENLGLQKQFDVSEWVEEFSNAHIYLLFKRPGEEAAAPVNTELDENGILTWTVSNWETGIIGVGFAEIRAIDDSTGLVKKSHVIPCSIEASITDEDTHPDYPSWVDRMITMNEHLESVYDDFEEELTDGVAAIQQEASTQNQTAVDAIQAKGETVIASIPSSYTDLIEALAGYTYNPNRHYDHGEFCWYDDKLWRRREDSAAIVGSWVEADWIEAPLTSFMAELGWDMESYTEQWGAMKAALYGEGITNYESENAYTAGAIVWQFRSNLGDIGFYRAKVDKAAGDPWVAADWEKLVGIDDKYVALFNEFIMVQNAQPDTANNRIWVQPQNTEYQVPTYAEFTALYDEVTNQKSAVTELDANKAPAIEDSASGPVASFSDGSNGIPLKSCVVSIEPVQEGTGDPSPDNVRPITGWTGVTVQKCGKNLLNASNVSAQNRYINTKTGSVVTPSDSSEWRFTDFTPIMPEGTLYFGMIMPEAGTPGIAFYDANRTFISGVSCATIIANGYTAQIPEKAAYFRHSFRIDEGYNTDWEHTVYICLDSAPHEWTAYQGESIPVSWESKAGAVYGGTLDVVSGVLTVTHAYYEVGPDFIDTADISSYGKYFVSGPKPSGLIASSPMISNKYVYATNATRDYAIRATSKLVIYDARFVDMETAKSLMGTVQIVYPLAEPQTYQLSPHEILSILGQNHVWADTGDTSVIYRADPKMYIQRLMGEQ